MRCDAMCGLELRCMRSAAHKDMTFRKWTMTALHIPSLPLPSRFKTKIRIPEEQHPRLLIPTLPFLLSFSADHRNTRVREDYGANRSISNSVVAWRGGLLCMLRRLATKRLVVGVLFCAKPSREWGHQKRNYGLKEQAPIHSLHPISD